MAGEKVLAAHGPGGGGQASEEAHAGNAPPDAGSACRHRLQTVREDRAAAWRRGGDLRTPARSHCGSAVERRERVHALLDALEQRLAASPASSARLPRPETIAASQYRGRRRRASNS